MLARMVRRIVVCAVLLVGVAGCSASKPAAAPAAPTVVVSASASASASGRTEAGLSDLYGQKLTAASNAGPQSACAPVSADTCGQAQQTVIAVLDDLNNVITSQGLQASYPKTLAAIDTAEKAATDYSTGGCAGNPAADVDGSPCFKASLDVLTSPSLVQSALVLDETSDKLGS